MSDRFAAAITLGGDVPRRLLDKLADMIASEGVSIDWQYSLDKSAVQKAIEDAVATTETIRFTDDQASYGQFEQLEGFLVKHRIHFDRHSEARYEYDGENVYYRGGRKVAVMLANYSGDPLVSCQDVRKILDNSKSDQTRLDAIRRLITVPAPLAPIRLV